MRIAIDAMGGDFAPQSIVEGAILASKELPNDAHLVLVGDENQIQQILNKNPHDSNKFTIVHSTEVIEMGEHPAKAFKQKQKSSIAIGYHLLKKGDVQTFCSAGNTGAMLVGAMFTIKAVEGIIRPGIAGFIPKENGGYGIVLDVGANADCKADVLNQFAEIGSIYANHVLSIENPKVGLMNLGEEEQKGTLLTQAAYQLLKINDKINFIGNIEGRNLFDDKADVIVCDGFTGNVILKMAESFYDAVKRQNIPENDFFNMFNYEAVGGSPILGINGNVIIGHGVSSPLATKNMISMGYDLAKSRIDLKIKEAYS